MNQEIKIELRAESSRYQSKLTQYGCPWVYSNELKSIPKDVPPGSWVSLFNSDGRKIAYGHFNPYSLISFRCFDFTPMPKMDDIRSLFFQRIDRAFKYRLAMFHDRFKSGEMHPRSFRLCFGESDGVPGLVCDLYSLSAEINSLRAVAVIQCHSAGADNFISWMQAWLSERLSIDSGLIKNDIDVRKRENVKLETIEWGKFPEFAYAIEGGVGFRLPMRAAQKTGYFYDLREQRKNLAARVGSLEAPKFLDAFSYIGAWGLQALKRNPKAMLTAVDASEFALECLRDNAKINKLSNQIESTVKSDLLKEGENLKSLFKSNRFEIVVIDPPSLTSSQQKGGGKKTHRDLFLEALTVLNKNDLSVIAFASCTYHLDHSAFLETIRDAAHHVKVQLRLESFLEQASDHPFHAALIDSRYLKSALGTVISTG